MGFASHVLLWRSAARWLMDIRNILCSWACCLLCYVYVPMSRAVTQVALNRWIRCRIHWVTWWC
jgi:hypothetical protein